VFPDARPAQPVHSIFASFASVEDLLESISEALNVRARNGALMGMLLKRELMSKDCIDPYNDLRLGRNALAHGKAAMPSVAESLEYVRQASYLDEKLSHVLEKLAPGKKRPPEEATP
jgi:hypothetical protein